MARLKNNIILRGISGQINQQVVLKTYGGKTFLSRYPDRTNVEYSGLQKAEQGLFAKAVAYARSIINDPAKKAAFKDTLEPGRRVYNAAITVYLREHKKNQDQNL